MTHVLVLFRVVQQLTDRLNEGLTVDFVEVSTLTIGALLKSYLRALPDSLFPLSLYSGMTNRTSSNFIESHVLDRVCWHKRHRTKPNE